MPLRNHNSDTAKGQSIFMPPTECANDCRHRLRAESGMQKYNAT